MKTIYLELKVMNNGVEVGCHVFKAEVGPVECESFDDYGSVLSADVTIKHGTNIFVFHKDGSQEEVDRLFDYQRALAPVILPGAVHPFNMKNAAIEEAFQWEQKQIVLPEQLVHTLAFLLEDINKGGFTEKNLAEYSEHGLFLRVLSGLRNSMLFVENEDEAARMIYIDVLHAGGTPSDAIWWGLKADIGTSRELVVPVDWAGCPGHHAPKWIAEQVRRANIGVVNGGHELPPADV